MRDKWIMWCDLNSEQECLAKIFSKDCVSISGATKESDRLLFLDMWENEDVPVLVTKPKIFGMGLNLQFCHNMCFVGLSDSFEAMYQAIRRCYRFGQKHPVNVHIIISEREGNVLQNIRRKESNAKIMLSKMVKHISVNTIKIIKSGATQQETKKQPFLTPKFMR